MEIRQCEVCGKDFMAKTSRSLICSDECRRNKFYVPTKKIKAHVPYKPAISIIEIDRLARKAGMTYGQYVSKMGL